MTVRPKNLKKNSKNLSKFQRTFDGVLLGVAAAETDLHGVRFGVVIGRTALSGALAVQFSDAAALALRCQRGTESDAMGVSRRIESISAISLKFMITQEGAEI